MEDKDQNKNLMLAIALSAFVMLIWYVVFPAPKPSDTPGLDAAASGEQVEVLAADATAPVAVDAQIAEAADSAAASIRLPIETPSVRGTIALTGARFDDLELLDYHETLDKTSPYVRLFNPVGDDNPYYALFGWVPASSGVAVPELDSQWRVEQGETLTPSTPVTLAWDNGAGLTFRRTISVDDKYMFHVEQSVENNTGDAVSLAPYGLVARHGDPDLVNFFILHEGVVRMTDGTLSEIEYEDVSDLSASEAKVTAEESGWIGFTDKYWMATLIPDTPGFSARARHSGDIYRSETVLPTMTIAAGETAVSTERLFAGAKEWATIREYQNNDGIDGFIDSIDWGWFFFLTKPMFQLLHNLNELIGNMGWSILALTLLLKLILFPIAYRSYASMARMRELQPEMEKMRKAADGDREKLQKGMMELYKTHKVNPAAGCLPMLLQIPIFFSLYKVIFVTIELRHAPWLGWIRDLSAPDPSSILNFFSLAPWAVPELPGFLSIINLGILAILLGVSMFLQQKLNPAPPDPTQKMIFAWMPWVFMFMLGGFASGLVIYWIANNTITFIQQYVIMRHHGYRPDLLGNIFGGKSGESSKK